MTVTITNTSSNLNKLETAGIFVSAVPVLKVYSGISNLINGSTHNMTASEALAGCYVRSATGDLDDTFPTAASIVSQLNSTQGTVAVGDSFELNIIRTTGNSSNDRLDFINNTGITFYGRNRFSGSRCSQIQFVVTNVSSGSEAVSLYSLHGNL